MADLRFSKVKLTLDGKQVELGLDQIRKKAEQTAAAMKGMEPNSKEWREAKKNLEALHAAEEDLIPTIERVNHYMKEMAKTSTTDLGKATRELTRLRDAMPGDHKDLDKINSIIDEFKDWMKQNRNLGVTFEKAKQQLNDLVNTPTDKLKQGLAAINKEMESTSSETRRQTLKDMSKKYEAEIAVRELGRAGGWGTFNPASIATEKIQKERSRLLAGYNATEGVEGYEAINKEYLDKLHTANNLLAERAEKERQLAQEQRKSKEEIENWNKAVEVWTRLNGGQKVSVEELTNAYKTLEQELKRVQGVDDNKAINIKNGIEQIKDAIEAIEGKQIDVNKIIDDPNATLEQMEAALKKLREEASQLPGSFDWHIKDTAEDIEELEQKIDDLKAKMQGIDNLDYDNLENVETDKLEAALKRLEQQEKKLKGTDEDLARQMAENKTKVIAQINKNKQAVLDVANAEKVAADTSKYKIQELQQAYDVLKQKLLGLRAGDKAEIERTQQMMKKLRGSIDEVTESVSKQSSMWKRAITNITAYVGVFGMFNFVKNKLTEIIRGSAELSDQMAQVRMVSGLAMEDIEGLTRTLAKLDTRTTLQELERISFAGAKLGFGEYGTQGLLEFTKAANQVNVALREDLGEEALAALSKITENMQLIKKMGVEQAMLATSSAMFKLAATSTAAAGPIVEVTKRLVPVAQASGFAAHEVLALASASDSLQLMPEVVGTALSKLIMALQNNHSDVEKYLSIPEGTLASMFKAEQGMQALMLVFDKMKGKNITELDGLWKLLGSDGQRLITVVQAMANHNDTLAKHLETSTKAFMEATAVTEEYNIQQETAQALLTRADNLWRNAFINADSSLAVKEMAKSWYDFSKAVLQSDFSLKAIQVTINTLLLGIRALINLLPMITFGLIAKGATLLITKLNLAKFATDGFTTSWKKMDAATKSNWIGLAVGLFAQLVFWIKSAADAMGEAEVQHKKMEESMLRAAEQADAEINAMSRLKNQIEDTTLAQEDRNKLFSKFKTDYDIYLNYLDIELKSVDDLAKHYDALTKVMKQRFAYQEREDYKRDVMGGDDGTRMKRRRAGAELQKTSADVNQKIDLAVIDSMIENGTTPAAVSVSLLGRRPNLPMSTPTDKLRDAIVHYAQAKLNEITEEKNINSQFAQEIGDFDYDKWLRTQVPGTFVTPGGGGGGGKGDKKEARADLKAAEQQAKAIIDDIKNYYQRQMNAVNEMANDADITEGDLQGRIDRLKGHLNDALANARKKIGGEKNDWEEFKASMRQDLWEQTDEQGYNFSENLLDRIMDNELDKLREMIVTLSKALGKDGNQLLDQILRKATENEGKNIKMETQMRKALEKEILEKNYTGKVDLDSMSTMERFGIGGITNRQDAQLQEWKRNGDTEAAKQFFADREKAWYAAFANARKNIIDVMNTDIEGKEGKEKLLTILFGTDYQNVLQGKELEGFLSMSEDQWRVFYTKLIDYNDAWVDAQKKAYEENKRRQDYLFNNSPGALLLDNATTQLQQLGQVQTLFGQDATFGRQMGMVDTINTDPEILRYDLLQARAEAYYNKMLELRKQDLVSEEQVKDAREQLTSAQIASQQKLMEVIQARTQTITSAIQPITDFAENAGQKLGDMMTGMESQSMTWNQIWKNMLLAMGKSIIQMGQQYAIQKLQRGLFNKQVEADEEMHQALLTTIALGGALARMQGELAIEKGALVMKKMVDGEEVTQEISLATILTSLGISEGAAKTIGKLGWWGIPLVAVISSLLMGLLSSALSTAGSESASSATSSTSATATKTKLVSGMLTYDEGNVGTYQGTDGQSYHATQVSAPADGLVTQPIATTVQGQPALVAERGPEIVIGRRTTRAIMMNEPGLIRYLANYGKGASAGPRYRAFDGGNLDDITQQLPDGQTTTGGGGITAADAQKLVAAIGAFNQTVNQMQQKGIPCYINKYGSGGLIDEVKSGMKFDSKYNK